MLLLYVRYCLNADQSYLSESFSALGIPLDKQSGLAAAVSDGRQLDSDSGLKPEVIETVSNADGTVTVTHRWKDGSATRSSGFPYASTGLMPGTVAPESVTGCATVNPVGAIQKNNCFVEHQALTWSGSFTASFSYTLDSGHQITSISNPLTGGIGMSAGTLSYIQQSANSTGTAIAQLNARQDISVSGIGTSRDVGLRLNVNTGGGSTSSFGS